MYVQEDFDLNGIDPKTRRPGMVFAPKGSEIKIAQAMPIQGQEASQVIILPPVGGGERQVILTPNTELDRVRSLIGPERPRE